MFCLTLSAISANVLEIRLPITSIYPLLMVNSITNTAVTVFYHDFRQCSQNSCGPPCGTGFYEVFTPFTHFYGLSHIGRWQFSEFCESSQNLRSLLTYMAPLFLTTKYHDVFNVCLGMGRLSQGERRGKEKSLSKKRVPTDRYVWGCNSQSA